MTTARFIQKAREAFVPIRKATGDTFLLTILTVICMAYLGLPVTHPFLFIFVVVLVFVLVYAVSLVLRLRQDARNALVTTHERQVSPIEHTAFTIVQGWSRDTTRIPPEEY